MATLDDIRNAGYRVRLAWKGWTEPDGKTIPAVYQITRDPDSTTDPTAPTGAMLVYLPDDPETLAAFLEQAESPTEAT